MRRTAERSQMLPAKMEQTEVQNPHLCSGVAQAAANAHGTDASADTMLGLTVRLPDPCECGCTTALIGARHEPDPGRKGGMVDF